MNSLRVAFAGTPVFAVPTLEALAGSPHVLVGVLTQPDRPSGRGRQLTASPVKRAALERGLGVAQPPSLRSVEALEALRALRPDVLVVVAYGQILPPEALQLPRLGCLNVHASLLPRWRGAAPIQRAILAGDAITGITIMQMDTGLDTGPMLLQSSLEISPEATSADLQRQLAPVGAAALLRALEQLATGTARARPQAAAAVTHAAKIDKTEARIDWHHSATAIARQVRAFNPWPIAETLFEGRQLRIHAARPAAATAARPPGTVLGLQDEALVVSCGEGALQVTRLQRPGGRPVTAREFAQSGAAAGGRFG